MNTKKYSVDVQSKKIHNIQKEFGKFISAKVKRLRNPKPLFELLIKDGRIIQIKQMIKHIDEAPIDISEFEIPSDFILLERGLPINLMKVSLRI